MSADIDYNALGLARARLREATVNPPPAVEAAELLRTLTERWSITRPVAVALAMHLAHIAGGDGRGVYVVMHDPEGDRL